MLSGARGRPPLPVDGLSAAVAAVGAALLADDLTLIELNPVIVSPSGAVAVDAVVRR
jgi:succinyl-CoA synthetase beta subunit